MSVSIRSLHPVFVGEVVRVDCRKPLNVEEVTAIEAGMDNSRRCVLRDNNEIVAA